MKTLLTIAYVILLIFVAAWGWGTGVGMERRKFLKKYASEHFSEQKQNAYMVFVIILATGFLILLHLYWK